MYRRVAGILFPVFALIVVGLGIWGYQENRDKNSILLKAENQYQSAFHNLNFHIDSLNQELGKALVTNSRKQLAPRMATVWRLAYAAQSDLGQLPLALVPFSHTEEFLSNVGEFAYRVALRDLEREPLNRKERQTLQALYQHSEKVKKELNGVQSKIIDNQLRWMDVEAALASEKMQSDNTIIDGFKTIDKTVQGFPEVDWGTVKALSEKSKHRYINLRGKAITKQEAKEIARRFIGQPLSKIEVTETGKGIDYAAYSVTATPQGSKDSIYLDVTKKGGHVIWMMNERKIAKPTISEEQALQIAIDFLEKRGLKRMTLINVQPYDDTRIFLFVPVQDGVKLMTDTVTVKVALDRGEITGFQAEEYVYHHKKRELPKPKLTEAEARKRVHADLRTPEAELTLVEDDIGNERLAYQFQGELNGHTYRIYIDAINGEEILVEGIKNIDAEKI
ncbi:MAG: germination protein YpeB [Bacillus thermozeamaize]|uniref:Germination protein YpeB n=1 Tax=Bacillus thermozeamaize TaxID=230954 RepID=A0A1Y3PQS3_9BACI|nr:MAG: germination protein YpeB [Bacillus thermozeamaize]